MSAASNPAPDEDFHRGLAALNFDLHNQDDTAPEIDYYQRIVERHPGPALDVGCGTGRLLRHYLKQGLDVDGCDISPDLLTICRRRAESEGLSPNLYRQSMADLDLPRRYDTIFVCGAFGLNGTRADDLEALRRFHHHMNDGGTLALDIEAGWSLQEVWTLCAQRNAQLPTPWTNKGWKATPEGDKLWGQRRILAVDPLEQSGVLEVRNELERGGETVASELHVLVERWYGKHEVIGMLEAAGFHEWWWKVITRPWKSRRIMRCRSISQASNRAAFEERAA
ncbi:MAG: class I SAM-dependent methyltransferase [Actinomycetota bacterium]|nr:class I SAM-dependent methyltransferase [Actinomycetota bacterium]